MRAINLLPRETQGTGSESRRAPLLVGAGGIAAVTALGVALFMSASGSVSDQRSQLDSVEAAIASLPSTSEPVLASGALAQERTDRVAALSSAVATRVPLDSLLRELALVLPEDAWLTGLTASAPASGTPTVVPGSAPAPGSATAPEVTIEGATYSLQSVARVLARLAALETLDGVRLTSSDRVQPTLDPAGTAGASTKKKAKKKTVVTFTIAANFRPAGTT